MDDGLIQCCRCRHKHRESERADGKPRFPHGIRVTPLVCPRCRAKSFYRLNIPTTDHPHTECPADTCISGNGEVLS